jgi:hypothetical protein
MKKTRPNLKSIISNNPNVDPRQLAEVSKLLRELRRVGIRPVEYDISPPFTRKLTPAGELPDDDASTENSVSGSR